MPTNTTNFNWLLPLVNNPIDRNVWGGYLNSNFTSLDTTLRALANQNKGPSAPTLAQAGTFWLDDTVATAWALKLYDGTSWATIGTIDPTTHTFTAQGLQVVVQTFSANGTYTPTTGMEYCIVECVGAGGAGGAAIAATSPIAAAGAGGGGGAYTRGIFGKTAIGVSQPVTVGAGGLGTAGTGTDGGDTIFGAVLLTAKGGKGGTGSAGTTVFELTISGEGGAKNVVNAKVALAGGAGSYGLGYGGNVKYAFAGNGGAAGIGGACAIGPQRLPATVGNAANSGNPGPSIGAGGSGAAALETGNVSGGPGADGAIIITEFITVNP